MKNREKFREQIVEWAVAPGRDICDFNRKEVLPHFGKSCGGISCSWCSILLHLWLDEEYEEPEVDWSKVPVDTLVRVRDCEDDEWVLRYFAGIDEEAPKFRFMAWDGGSTRKTSCGEYTYWKYCELVEEAVNLVDDEKAACHE